MTHLRRYLEQTAAVPPDALDSALRRQQIYGGSLDTVLLELDVCDPHTLGELLVQACGLPIVNVDLLENGIDRPWDSLPEELLEIGWAVPLAATGAEIIVGVHPDLPNERLGALYRQVERARPVVTPECALEKIAAERTSSVVPQRYAVLCAAYVSAIKRRPSVSNTGMPIIPPGEIAGPGPSEDRPTDVYGMRSKTVVAPEDAVEDTQPRGSGPTIVGVVSGEVDTTPGSRVPSNPDTAPAAPAPPAQPPPAAQSDEPPAQPPPAAQSDEPRAHNGAVADTLPGTDSAKFLVSATAVPEFVDRQGAGVVAGAPEAVQKTKSGTVISSGAPPVRFTARGTMISTTDHLEAAFEEGEIARRMAGARAILEGARSRDAAMDALIQATMVVSPRVAVFRVRAGELLGLSTPRTGLPDIGGEAIPTPAGSELATAIEELRWAGEARDPDLMRLLDINHPVPCMLHRIDVAGRAVMVVYIDHNGREFLPAEANLLEELCEVASRTFETVLRLRRAAVDAEPKPAGDASSLAPPPAFGTTEPRGWGPPPKGLAGEAKPGRARRRATQVDGSPPTPMPETDSSRPILTVNAIPPPPSIPPPPRLKPPDVPDTDPLLAVPPAITVSDSSALFAPPPFDEDGIVPLSSPIDQPTARGKIALDDEDFSHPGEQLASESAQRRIDAVLKAITAGDTDTSALGAFGEQGMMRLAAQFPGPLEVLRRDLRALPPPSAHGPNLRMAISLGPPMVPHLLDLFDHPDPDVRFYAAFVFQELRDSRGLRALAELAFDPTGDVRVIAMRVLETYNRFEGFHGAVAFVRQQLDSSNRTRQLYSARAVGTLRDGEAIPKLVELLASKDRFIQEASLESLCSITGQQHGLKPHRWKAWHRDNQGRHRVEWIIESLRHRDLPVRRWAHDELVRVTGHRVPFSPLGDRKSREIAAEAWIDWWKNAGKGKLTPEASP